MEMLEEQQREEMELAALQEEQENEQVRQRRIAGLSSQKLLTVQIIQPIKNG